MEERKAYIVDNYYNQQLTNPNNNFGVTLTSGIFPDLVSKSEKLNILVRLLESKVLDIDDQRLVIDKIFRLLDLAEDNNDNK